MKIILIVLALFVMITFNVCAEDKIMEVKDFQKEVLESDKLVLVDFWATWCKPCKIMSEYLERIVIFNDKYNKNKVEIYKANVDVNRKLMSKYFVRGLPTLIYFKDGKEVARFIGLTPFLKIQGKITSLLKVKKKDDDDDGCDGTCPPPEG